MFGEGSAIGLLGPGRWVADGSAWWPSVSAFRIWPGQWLGHLPGFGVGLTAARKALTGRLRGAYAGAFGGLNTFGADCYPPVTMAACWQANVTAEARLSVNPIRGIAGGRADAGQPPG